MVVGAEISIGQIYEHYSGKRYEIVAIGRLTESDSLQECVIYKGLYNDPQFGNNPIWIRPLSMFIESVEINGKKMKRFKLISTHNQDSITSSHYISNCP